MTHERDIERLLDHWFTDGPTEAPARVIDVVADRIGRRRERPGWRLEWRLRDMNPFIKVGAAVAAVVLIAVVGYNLLPGSPSVGGPPATPSASATPIATPSPTPSPSPAPRLSAMKVQGDPASWTATVPNSWTGRDGWYLTPIQGTTGPTGISVSATGAVNVPTDPCDGVGKVSEAKSVADVLAELEARDDLVVSNAVDTTLGGYAGTRVDVQVPADLSACDDLYIIFAEPDGSGFYAQGPSNLLRIWILDVQGRPIVFWVQSFPGTPPDDLAEAQQIVDSIVITP